MESDTVTARDGATVEARIRRSDAVHDAKSSKGASRIPPCSVCSGRLDAGSYFCPRCIRYESMTYVRAWKQAQRGPMQDTVYFEAGSEIDKADRELRHAAHVYAKCATNRKQVARQALRRAAIAFTAAAQELLPKTAR